ncbi:hypothetical protein ACLOAU_17435 [Niabella sp. CJ426]|jgi:hypothetical protein|uniref:hypothetical protein n=1 Tax=Niabella sp. CJ426 TaxID=3393740 RepID=UPI003D004C3F
MRFIKAVHIALIVLFLLLVAFDLLLVLPEYCACSTAAEGAIVITFWGYSLDCIGDTAEFSWVFFQMIGLTALVVLTIIIIMYIISYKNKVKKGLNRKL